MLGGALRQHSVEFVAGYGVITDGVLDSTSIWGPWSWTVPSSAGDFSFDVIAGGQGGGGGGDTTPAGTISVGGGAGGASVARLGYKLMQPPGGTVLTVTLGAGGAGGAVGGVSSFNWTYITYGGADYYCNSTNSVTAAININVGLALSLPVAAATSTSASAAAGIPSLPPNAAGSDYSQLIDGGVYGALFLGGGMQGGAGNASGSVAGANGQGSYWYDTNLLNIVASTPAGVGGNGDTTGTISRGGGGAGALSPLFRPYPPGTGTWGTNNQIQGVSPGGNAGATPPSPTMPGAGGGGGGGGAPGAPGAPGYARITYWSAD